MVSAPNVSPPTDPDPRIAPGELELADELGRQLVRLLRLINRTRSQVTKQGPDGIERAAYAILACLIHEGPQRTSELADALHAEISTISRQSSALVQHGLLERQVDPSDGRACQLAPTAEGRRVFGENRKQRNLWLTTVLSSWDEEDRQALITLLARLNASIENNAGQSVCPQSTPDAQGGNP